MKKIKKEKNVKNNELAVMQEVKPPAVKEPTILTLIDDAMKKGLGLDFIKELRDIRDQEQARVAKEEFIIALNQFKQEAPPIINDKTNNQFGSKYASIKAVVVPYVPLLSKHGLSHRWDYPVPKKEGMISVTCILTHKVGHSETVNVEGPPDSMTGISKTTGQSSKNPIQQIKSTMTYLKIITFEAVTGLVAVDENVNIDDDGNSISRVNGMDEGLLGDLIQNLNDATTEDEVKERFRDAYNAAKKAKDADALMKLSITRDNVWAHVKSKSGKKS